LNIVEFISDRQLINNRDLSPYQETFLRLLYGLPLTKEQLEIAEICIGRPVGNNREYNEATAVCGRRSGKTDRLAANIAVFEAALGGHDKFLAPGERAHVALIAQDMRAARIAFRYIEAKLQDSPLLAQLVEEVRKEEIDLKNRITITIMPCSFRATRGFAIPVAIIDELAFFRVEGAVVDREVIDAIRPAQATFERSKLIKISSPYAKQGELYRDFVSRQSRPDFLCFQAASWLMNPSIPQAFLDGERERDAELFDREFAALFSVSISNAFNREAVEACVIPGRFELPPVQGIKYRGAVDPSGGGSDEMTLSICHREKDIIVQDCLRARHSQKPQDVVEEYAQVLKSYSISEVSGDRYSGSWVQDSFRQRGITYTVAEKTASEAFLELLPLINQGTVSLLDDKRQTAQLISLERRKGRSGKDAVGHPPGGHDDRANALALACVDLAKPAPGFFCWASGSDRMLVNGAIVQATVPPVAPERTIDIFSQSLERQKNSILQKMRTGL